MNDVRIDDGVSLNLADGQEWRLIATAGTRPLVARAAMIMGLKPCRNDCDRKILYVADTDKNTPFAMADFDRYAELDRYPRGGWRTISFGHVSIWSHEETRDIICAVSSEDTDSLNVTKIFLTLYPVYTQTILAGGLPFHAALLEFEGKGILIAARSGTGKSTCCQRIIEPWHPVCDDEVLIVKTGDGYRAHAFPTWNDFIARSSSQTWDVQRSIPVSAIFFLEQSPADSVEPAGDGMAAYAFYHSSQNVQYRFNMYLPKDKVYRINKKLFDNACALSKATPSFKLRASLAGKFWEEMAPVLR